MGDRMDLLLAEYSRLADKHRSLVEVRFKLLAFVPTVTGVGVAYLRVAREAQGAQAPAAAAEPASSGAPLAIAVFGFVVTVGVILYEVRNSQIHDLTVHMQKELAQHLGLPSLGNPGMHRLFGVISVWHDRALGIVYGTCVGTWSALIAYECVPSLEYGVGLVGLAIGLVFYWQIVRINNLTKKDIGRIYPEASRRKMSQSGSLRWPQLDPAPRGHSSRVPGLAVLVLLGVLRRLYRGAP